MCRRDSDPWSNRKSLQVLYGSLLGDGHIDRAENRQSRFMEGHSSKQLEYLKWKTNFFLKYDPKIYHREPTDQFMMQTKCHPFFTTLRRKFYPDGHKIIPPDILKRMDSLALAVWYMDDGSFRRSQRITISITLHTHCFTLTEVELLQMFLRRKWEIDATIQMKCVRQRNEGKFAKSKLYPQLYIRTTSAPRFLSLVRPHVLRVPCMYYKVGE